MIELVLDQDSCLLTFGPSANLVLQDTVERIYSGNFYAEDPVGLFLVRGENVLLLGEIVRTCSSLSFLRKKSTDLSRTSTPKMTSPNS